MTYLPSSFVSVTETSPVRGSTVEIRIQNLTELDFEDVVLAGEPIGDVRAGASTDYEKVKLHFRYCVMYLTAGGYRVNAQTLNFGSQRFTHRVLIKNLEAGHLGVVIVRDD